MANQLASSIAERGSPSTSWYGPLACHWLALLGAAALAIVVWISYFPALRGGFIWDDNLLVAGNRLVHAPDGLYRIWFTTEPYDYWPLTNTMFWIEWRLWGTNPTGYHVVNLLLQIAAALLLWKILSKLSIPGAYLAAVLFAVHPVNVESVAWIAQGKNTLAMLFFLLSTLCYLRQEGQQRGKAEEEAGSLGRWYWLSLFAFLLAMLSKGSVAILPLVLLLIVWWQQRRITCQDLWRTAPFFLIAVVLTVVNIYFQTHGGEAIRTASMSQRLAGAGAVVWFYLSKALLPLDLIFVYPQWHIEVRELLWWLPLLAALVVTAALGWCAHWRQFGLGPGHAVRLAFFCVALLPVLGMTDVYFMKFALVADHYQYIALIGVVVLMAAGLSAWYGNATHAARSARSSPQSPSLPHTAWLARQQSSLYADSITLYRATLRSNPDCWLAHVNLGQEFLGAGRVAEATSAV